MHRNSAFAVWALGQVAIFFGIRNYLEAQTSFTSFNKFGSLPLISILTGFGIAILFEVGF